MFKLKRVYEAPSPDDGVRVLVDRLWPRGVTKARAALDLWLKDIGAHGIWPDIDNVDERIAEVFTP